MDYVLFHAKKVSPYIPCVDGLFAAYAARLSLTDSELIPAMYGAKNCPQMKLKEGDRIFLLDLTGSKR